MPLAMSIEERLRRARALYLECVNMPEPAPGIEHGHWLVKVKSRLGNAQRMLRSGRFITDPKKKFLIEQNARARELNKLIDRFWDTRIMPHYDTRK